MKILFAGPTLHGLAEPGTRFKGTDILCRAPAQQGDIARATLDGASVIGLVDGRYEDVAAPWHKEILYAIDKGVRVLGAASMGALRAAECAAYGMIPVGTVAARYLKGELVDDAAVAQIHGPPELGCVPLSEALVNVEATISDALEAGALSPAQATRLRRSAAETFFKDRTSAEIIRRAGFRGSEADAVTDTFEKYYHDIKRDDALLLIDVMHALLSIRVEPIESWRFKQPPAWQRYIKELVDLDTTMSV